MGGTSLVNETEGGTKVKIKNAARIMPSGVKEFVGKKVYIDTRSVSLNKIVDNKTLVEYCNRPSRANMEAREGDVLFAKMQNTPKVILINPENEKFIYSTGFFVMRPKPDKILSEYLYYWFNFEGTQALKDRLAHGGTQQAINAHSINNKFDIFLPDLNTQKDLVVKLKQIEDIVDKLEMQRGRVKLLLRNLRERLFENPPQYQPLQKLLKKLYRYPTFYGFEYVPTGIPVLKISNMDEEAKFGVDETKYDYISTEVNGRYPNTIVEKDDLIMEVRGTYIGKCALVPDSLVGANISPNTIRMSCDKEKILPGYLWHYTFTEGWRNQIAWRTNYWKGGFGTIKSSQLRTVEIPVFELNSQLIILDKLNRVEAIHDRFLKDVQNSRNLYQWALKRIFIDQATQ